MAFNPFIGRSLPDLECDLKAAQDDLAAGKTIISSGVGETRKGEKIDVSPTERIRRILVALHRIDPKKYPVCDISPDRQTRVSFRPDQRSDNFDGFLP
jgi:dihydropteroate synthase